MPKVSAIMTFHAEGILAERMLRGFSRTRSYAERNGLTVEVVAVLDSANDETQRIVKESPHIQKTDRIIEVTNRDLGLSRNDGVRHASGDFIAVFDGDDYYSENWIFAAFEVASKAGVGAVVHPQLTVSFGSVHCVTRQFDMDTDDYALAGCFSIHPWISCSFGRREIYLAHPYSETRTKATGFGYEDWHWNVSLVGDGIRHLCAPTTALFYRRKASSMLTGMEQERAIIRPSSFFDRADIFMRQDALPNRKQTGFSKLGRFIRNTFKKYGATSKIVPAWAVYELRTLAVIESDITPTKEFLARFHFYKTPQKCEPAYAYGRFLSQLGDFKPDALFIIPWLSRGGADLGIIHHVRLAASLGKKVLVLSTEAHDSPWVDRVSSLSGVKFVEYGKLAGHLEYQCKVDVLTRILLQTSARTIHVINSDLGWRVFQDHARCFKSIGKYIFASAYCWDIIDGVKWGYPKTYKDVVPKLHGLICDTMQFPAELVRDFGFDSALLHTAYFPCDITGVDSLRPRNSGEFKVLWAGRFSAQKRADLLVSVATKMPDVRFEIHGCGDIYSGYDKMGTEIREKLASLPNVVMFGAFDSIQSVVETAKPDLFLYTSAWDGLPNILLEVTQLGLPVVASAVGGVPELISERSGFPVTDIDNPDAYVVRIREAMGDADLCCEKWRTARDLVRVRHAEQAFLSCMTGTPGYLS